MMANGKVTKERGEGVSDRAYLEWIADLKRRYRRTQIKAAVAVNSAMLEFYWTLGRDISRKYPGKKRNLGFFDNLSSDLCLGIKNPVGLSASNLRYAYRFFELYSYVPRVAEDNGDGSCLQQLAEDNASADYLQQVVADNWVADLMKIGFYMVAVDRQLKNEWDAPTVGLVLCRDGNRTVVEYALSVTDRPMGVAKYRLTQKTPKELSSMKRAVAKLGTVVDETINDVERARRTSGGVDQNSES